nr:copia protein [Tanacetum cinerariifolium]
MENELCNLTIKGTDVIGYTMQFQELALLCPYMVMREEKKIERYIWGLTYDIRGKVIASRLTKIYEEIRMTCNLMDQVIRAKAAKDAGNKRKWEDEHGGNPYQQQEARSEKGYTKKYCPSLENQFGAREACQDPNIVKEAVNTACYVQNRVLVNKAHNKTPYELFNVVDAGINSTNFSGTKVDARQDVKKDVSSLRYIILPNWVHEEYLESTLSQPQDACNTDASESSGNLNPIATSTNPPADQLETLTVETPIPVPIGTKWVLKNKKDERGIVIRNKAKLGAQGHTQKEGIDYDEVFALVARIEAIRLFLAYASFMGFTVYQMDVKSAFLYGTIDEEVYVIQPPGFQDPEYPARIYKVEKAMYGLHQAPRA